MLQFHAAYVGSQMLLLDVCTEKGLEGDRSYVASLSSDPRVCVRASRPELALAQLTRRLNASPATCLNAHSRPHLRHA